MCEAFQILKKMKVCALHTIVAVLLSSTVHNRAATVCSAANHGIILLN